MQIRISSCLIVLALAWQTSAIPSLADDFPGKGDRFAWSNALPYYNLANKYLEHGRFEEAKANFEEAIYRYEFDADFYINYGVALRKLESYSAAEEAFKKAIELRSNDWQAWSNLANANLKQNKLKETIACFQKAMKMQPPPPAAEKEAMLKDIADINKILSMQQPPPAAAKATQGKGKKKGDSLRHAPNSLAGRGDSLRHAPNTLAGRGDSNSSAANESAGQASNDKQTLQKSGWDWVQ